MAWPRSRALIVDATAQARIDPWRLQASASWLQPSPLDRGVPPTRRSWERFCSISGTTRGEGPWGRQHFAGFEFDFSTAMNLSTAALVADFHVDSKLTTEGGTSRRNWSPVLQASQLHCRRYNPANEHRHLDIPRARFRSPRAVISPSSKASTTWRGQALRSERCSTFTCCAESQPEIHALGLRHVCRQGSS